MKSYIVTAAVLTHENKYLCMQRGPSKYDYVSYKYEFPGGKVEAGESNEDGLSRELMEEMKIQVSVKPEYFFHTVTHKYPDFKITMHSYLCPVESKEFTLIEHVDYKWLNKEDLLSLDWAPADVPIVEKLMRE